MSKWFPSSPIQDAVVVTPSDTGEIEWTRGLYVGVSGAVKVRMQPSGRDATFVALGAGVIHPICVDRVYATGTVATDILALY